MTPIKVIKNFISQDEANRIIDYIERNHTSFSKDPHGLWFKKFFGLDALYRAGACEGIIDGLGDIKDLSNDIANSIKDAIAQEYGDDDDIFLNSMWFVKHLPGAILSEHVDTNDGTDYQFAYSSVVYLNTIEDGGDLEFPNLNLSVKPELGDLVIFPSVGEDMLHGVSFIGQERYTLPVWFTKDKDLELKFK